MSKLFFSNKPFQSKSDIYREKLKEYEALKQHFNTIPKETHPVLTQRIEQQIQNLSDIFQSSSGLDWINVEFNSEFCIPVTQGLQNLNQDKEHLDYFIANTIFCEELKDYIKTITENRSDDNDASIHEFITINQYRYFNAIKCPVSRDLFLIAHDKLNQTSQLLNNCLNKMIAINSLYKTGVNLDAFSFENDNDKSYLANFNEYRQQLDGLITQHKRQLTYFTIVRAVKNLLLRCEPQYIGFDVKLKMDMDLLNAHFGLSAHHYFEEIDAKSSDPLDEIIERLQKNIARRQNEIIAKTGPLEKTINNILQNIFETAKKLASEDNDDEAAYLTKISKKLYQHFQDYINLRISKEEFHADLAEIKYHPCLKDYPIFDSLSPYCGPFIFTEKEKANHEMALTTMQEFINLLKTRAVEETLENNVDKALILTKILSFFEEINQNYKENTITREALQTEIEEFIAAPELVDIVNEPKGIEKYKSYFFSSDTEATTKLRSLPMLLNTPQF